jgi:hypothetical protein
MNREIVKAFHDIRNTYSGLIMHFDESVDFKLDYIDIAEKMWADIVLIDLALQSCKKCEEAQNGEQERCPSSTT